MTITPTSIGREAAREKILWNRSGGEVIAVSRRRKL
jgi:hypothetical protein